MMMLHPSMHVRMYLCSCRFVCSEGHIIIDISRNRIKILEFRGLNDYKFSLLYPIFEYSSDE